MFWILGRVLDSGTSFWILGRVLDSGLFFFYSGTCFWILGSVLDSGKRFGFWDVFLDSGKCFGFWEVFCIVPTNHRKIVPKTLLPGDFAYRKNWKVVFKKH